MIIELITRAVIKSLERVGFRRGATTQQGVEGRISRIVLLFPIFICTVSAIFASSALKAPDQDDRDAGYIVLACAVGIGLAGIYLYTYKVNFDGEVLRQSSLFTADQYINLNDPFDLSIGDGMKSVTLRQDRYRIKLTTMMSGYGDLLHQIIQRHSDS